MFSLGEFEGDSIIVRENRDLADVNFDNKANSIRVVGENIILSI